MKNWENIEADENLILNKHFTPGRAGTINKIVLHHNAGNLPIRGCYTVWQDREASAHYQVQSDGRIGQQKRSTFGLSYRTKVGNDVDGQDKHYKLHLLYGCTSSPSERAYATVNESQEAMTFSWEISTNPENVTGQKPTSLITIDSREADPEKLKQLEAMLYGGDETEPTLQSPDEVVALFGPKAESLEPTDH